MKERVKLVLTAAAIGVVGFAVVELAQMTLVAVSYR